MRIEIRDQKPGDTWPSGQAWEIPDAANLLAICADLTRDEIVHVMRSAGDKPRAAHAVAQEIEAVLKKRGDDVLIVKREVVKVRRALKGTAALAEFRRRLLADGNDAGLQYLCPSLSRADAEELGVKVRPEDDSRQIETLIRDHFAAMGPVEIMTVDDPGQPS